MYVPDITLHDARDLEEAAELFQRYREDARFLAGGTDLLVDLKTGRVRAKHVIALQRVTAMRGIEETPDGLHIGALTTISQLNRSAIVRSRFRPLIDAASQMAAPQVRNAATVGGNIASAVPCADLPPILTAMNAKVLVWSNGNERETPLESFVVNVRQTKLEPGEVLTAVLVPFLPDRFGAAYARFALRDGNAIAVASVAAGLQLAETDTIADARIVLGAVAPMPVLVTSASSVITGRSSGHETWDLAARKAAAAARPICDVRGSADFRKEIVTVLTRRALEKAFQRAKEVRS